MRNILRGIKFGLDDIVLIIYLLFALFIIINVSIIFGKANPINTPTPFWLIAVSFSIAALAGIFYLYLNFKKKWVKPYHIILLSILIICNAVSIYIHPETISLVFRKGEGFLTLSTTISTQVKTLFFFSIFCLLVAFYFAIFIFPRRLVNIKVLEWIGIIVLSFNLFLIVFSLISEISNYKTFIKMAFDLNFLNINSYAAKSIFSHHNIFGMYLEFGFLSCILNFLVSKKKFYLFLLLPVFIFLFFTMCKTGLLLCITALICFSIFYLVKSIIIKNKFSITLNFIFLAAVLVLVIVLIVLVATNEKVKSVFDNFFDDGISISGRKLIWDLSLTIIKDNVFIGYGFGPYNSLLYVANSNVIPDYTSVTHSWFLSILGRGGIVFLLAYLYVLGYSLFHLLNIYRKNISLAFGLTLFFVVFFLHSFLEDNYYVLILICFEIITASMFLKQKDQNSYNPSF